jgi:hypothetical protein
VISSTEIKDAIWWESVPFLFCDSELHFQSQKTLCHQLHFLVKLFPYPQHSPSTTPKYPPGAVNSQELGQAQVIHISHGWPHDLLLTTFSKLGGHRLQDIEIEKKMKMITDYSKEQEFCIS